MRITVDGATGRIGSGVTARDGISRGLPRPGVPLYSLSRCGA